jgi:hypothetical protein
MRGCPRQVTCSNCTTAATRITSSSTTSAIAVPLRIGPVLLVVPAPIVNDTARGHGAGDGVGTGVRGSGRAAGGVAGAAGQAPTVGWSASSSPAPGATETSSGRPRTSSMSPPWSSSTHLSRSCWR